MASSARIDELRKKFDENPRRYFAPLANEYRKAGDLEQAIFICQEYLPQQPGHMSGHIVYGQALFELNRHEEAKGVFETALSLDPENLIALRHLGDIARATGDTNSARLWYQRVLEADPRNEEIAQLMMSLLSTDAPPAVDHNAPTPLNNPAVPPPSFAAPAAPPPDTGFHIEKSEEAALATPPKSAPPPPPPAPEKSYVSRHAPKEEELLDLDSFDLGGVPLSTLRSSKAVPVEEDFAPSAASSDAETPSGGLLDLPGSSDSYESLGEEPSGEPDEPFEADPFAIAAKPEAAEQIDELDELTDEKPADEPREPAIELATDVVLGLPDDGTGPAAATADEGQLAGLETFEAGVLPTGSIPMEGLTLETQSFIETRRATEPSLQAVEPPAPPPEPPVEMLGEGEEPAAEPAEAFVTETMATLYLQQGHLESALEIYRKLVEQRPDDMGLRARAFAVEAEVANANAPAPSFAEEPADLDEPFAAPTPSFSGPTIREFLSGLVSRRAAAVAEASMDAPVEAAEYAPEYAPEPAMEFEVSATAELPVIDEPPMPARPTPSSSETVGGSLGVLFSGADAASEDTAAANTLAEAFAPEGPENAPLHGVPAHRASKELSLNHVFKAATPPRPSVEGDDFSFDQFFSETAEASPAPATDTPAAGTPEATEDIAQFNAWLNGLKKT